MSHIFKIIFIIVLFPSTTAICSCPPQPHWTKATPMEYTDSNDVIIGDVNWISHNGLEYKVEVCEVFKGALKPGEIIEGQNDGTCGPYVDKKGEWVMFGQYFKTFWVNDCGISSCIADPNQTLLPFPPPPNVKYDEEKFAKNWKMELRKIISKQIDTLRVISQNL